MKAVVGRRGVAVEAATGRVAGVGRAFASAGRDGMGAAGILGGLAFVVLARWAATNVGIADAVSIGTAFAMVLATLAVAGGERLRRPSMGAVAAGVATGLALVALALLTRVPGLDLGLRPAAAFVPWAIVTVLVASAEEAVLRGAALAAIARASGPVVAVAVTSIAFALMHVPLYGWHVVPLDFGVGLVFGGLRLVTGDFAAPAIAHSVADLATWWL